MTATYADSTVKRLEDGEFYSDDSAGICSSVKEMSDSFSIKLTLLDGVEIVFCLSLGTHFI